MQYTQTPLIVASQTSSAHLDVVNALLAAGADVNIKAGVGDDVCVDLQVYSIMCGLSDSVCKDLPLNCRAVSVSIKIWNSVPHFISSTVTLHLI